MVVLAELAAGQVSIQCDICIPPVLTVNTPAQLARNGWTLHGAKVELDACPNCTARVAPRNRAPRADPTPTVADPERLPNVVVIGAMKAGTTSMHNYLDLHPEVGASTEKEMRFYSDPSCGTWVGRYQDHFPAGTRLRVESSPHYTKFPTVPGVVDRMAELVPEARLIYLVRDPIDRIIAEYVEEAQWRAVNRSIDEELADPEDPSNALMASSRYATQLEEFLRRFDRAQVLVVDMADLGSDVAGTMQTVFGFLDLDAPASTAADYGRYNTHDEKHQLPGWLMAIRRGPLVRAARRLPAGPRQVLSRAAWRRTGTLVGKPILSAEVDATVRRSLRPEVDRLRELTGADYATWSL